MVQNSAVSNDSLTQSRPERAKYVLLLLSEVFCLISLFVFASQHMMYQTIVALLSVAVAAVPYLVERYSGYTMTMALYVFFQTYCLGMLLGDGYNWYYHIPWWDKLMHTSAGVVFAVLGFLLVELTDKQHAVNLWMRAAFAVCFSVTVSALWEFFEFGLDCFFGTDMQGDTYITFLNSYILGSEAGTVGSISSIDSVIINGQEMEGYIDIGIIDTMLDMIVETLGAVALAVIALMDKSGSPLFTRREPKTAE